MFTAPGSLRRARDSSGRLGGGQGALTDTISRIFSERASFELRDDDVEALRKQLRNGAGLSPGTELTAVLARQEAEELDAWKAEHPCLLTHLQKFLALAQGKRVTVFMDYDGTLTPIVKDPDRAFMSDQMRDAVRAVARLFPTAIISGRGREKVQDFVQLGELYYAGSHGMDICGPTPANSDGKALLFQAAARFQPVMDAVYAQLVERTAHIPGASVEHNKFCVSVHFRNCEPGRLDDVIGAVEAVLASDKELKATRGRKVLEIRPEVEWNKGHALAHLLQSLDLGDESDVVPIYIGDDRTDEDAFAVLNQRRNGVGILVSSKVKPTEAVYTLRDPLEVMSFLGRLVDWGRGEANAWHAAKACTGWRLNPQLPPAAVAAATASAARSDSSGSAGSIPRARGRPPLFPPERTRSDPADSVGSPLARLGSRGSLQASTVPNGLPENGAAPASPFDGVPAWAPAADSPPRQPAGAAATASAAAGATAATAGSQ